MLILWKICDYLRGFYLVLVFTRFELQKHILCLDMSGVRNLLDVECEELVETLLLSSVTIFVCYARHREDMTQHMLCASAHPRDLCHNPFFSTGILS